MKPRYEDNPDEDVAIGLDLHDHQVRVVCGFPHPFDVGMTLHAWDCFSSRESFQRYWVELLHPRWHAHVAAAGDLDLLGIIPWLRQQGIYLIWPPVLEPDLTEELALLDLPRAYGRAYDLCLTACFRVRPDSVQIELWRECQRLQRRITRVATSLGRLIAPCAYRLDLNHSPLPPPPTAYDDRPPRPIDEIPF